MHPNPAVTSRQTIHQRYRQLLRGGFTPEESAALLAVEAGIARHAEGEALAATGWRWQEISRIEFLAHLVGTGRVGGPGDGRP